MTYEQYGSGPWGVRITRFGFSGQYRFETEAEAREYQAKNGGRVFRSRRAMGDIFQAAALADRADPRPGKYGLA